MTTNQKARFAVSIYFLLGGTGLGIWAVHIPLVEKHLGLAHSQLGSVLLLLGAGAFISMQILGWVIDHFGSRLPTVLGGVAMTAALTLPSLANNVFELAAAVLALGIGMGALDVSMNAHAVLVEKRYQRAIFSSFHAYWSAGGILGGAVGAATLALHLEMQTTLPVASIALATVSLLLSPWLLAEHSVAGRKNAATAQDRNQARSKNREVSLVVLAVGVMAAFAAIAEGSNGDWSALHLTTIIGSSASVAAWGLVAFSVSMTVMRLLGDKVVERFGRLWAVRWGSLFGSLGLVLVALANNVFLTLAGWTIFGIGVSSVIPQLMAMGAELGDAAFSGRNLARVTGLTYAGILAGPALIGWLTAWMRLNLAIGVGGALCVVVFLLTYFLPKAKVAK
jgi:MFS family permease